MIYSRSAEYAIRAFVHLAQVQEGKYAMVKNIAEQETLVIELASHLNQEFGYGNRAGISLGGGRRALVDATVSVQDTLKIMARALSGRLAIERLPQVFGRSKPLPGPSPPSRGPFDSSVTARKRDDRMPARSLRPTWSEPSLGRRGIRDR